MKIDERVLFVLASSFLLLSIICFISGMEDISKMFINYSYIAFGLGVIWLLVSKIRE